jgi:hypothetical protein
LNDKSRIVRTFSMQALADIAAQDAALRPSIISDYSAITQLGQVLYCKAHFRVRY